MNKFIKKAKEFFADTAETLLISFAIFIVVYWLLAQPFEVNGDSMQYSFENGEHLLTDKLSYRFKEPGRGEVIVFKFPRIERYDYIKRIVALPGERIKIQKGIIYIYNEENPYGYELEEPYLNPNTQTRGRSFIEEGKETKVPEGHYVVLGDNRENSSDSREWGFVPIDNIIGRAIFRYWPPVAFGAIENPEYSN